MQNGADEGTAICQPLTAVYTNHIEVMISQIALITLFFPWIDNCTVPYNA